MKKVTATHQAASVPPVRRTRRRRSVRRSDSTASNIMQFCKEFNARTQAQMGDLIIPVLITVYADRSFTFITKTPPASILLKKAAKIEKGSGEPNKNKVGKVTKKQVREIAELKLPDLNTTSIESAMRSVAGTARSMGLEVVD